MTPLILALFATIPLEGPVVRESCTTLERNTVYDEYGDVRLVQIIAKDRYSDGREHVPQWWLSSALPPVLSTSIVFEQNGHLIHLRAERVIETATYYDPEVADKQWLPERFRVAVVPERIEAMHPRPGLRAE